MLTVYFEKRGIRVTPFVSLWSWDRGGGGWQHRDDSPHVSAWNSVSGLLVGRVEASFRARNGDHMEVGGGSHDTSSSRSF